MSWARPGARSLTLFTPSSTHSQKRASAMALQSMAANATRLSAQLPLYEGVG